MRAYWFRSPQQSYTTIESWTKLSVEALQELISVSEQIDNHADQTGRTRLKSSAQMTIGQALTDKIIRLSGRLPEIWRSPQTTDAKRKALLRWLVEKVVLDRGEHDVGLVRIVWRGGAVSELRRILELAQAKMHDDEIAALLTEEGHRSPNCAERVLPITVQRIRLHAGVRQAEQKTLAPFVRLPERARTRRRLGHPCKLSLRADQARTHPDRSPPQPRTSVQKYAKHYRRGLGFDLTVNIRVVTIPAHHRREIMPAPRHACEDAVGAPLSVNLDHVHMLVQLSVSKPVQYLGKRARTSCYRSIGV